jgi:hypothetical protein
MGGDFQLAPNLRAIVPLLTATQALTALSVADVSGTVIDGPNFDGVVRTGFD